MYLSPSVDETIVHTRGAIAAYVALRLPGFRIMGGQLSAIIVGSDLRGAVGVVWRPDDISGITADDWQQARAEAAMLGYGPGLTLLGTHSLIPPSSGKYFIQVVAQGNRWVPLLGWQCLDQLDVANDGGERSTNRTPEGGGLREVSSPR